MKNGSPRNCIVVCGPTASGKTRLGVRIALHYNGEIISCDSRQVYRGMDIGTGKDLSEYQTEKGAVPFHLVDIVDPAIVYNVAMYQSDFSHAFNAISARKRLPIVVGGTGLYLEAVLKNYRIPEAPEDPDFRFENMKRDKSELIEELKNRDPELYRATDLKSKKRVVRSLEIVRHKKKFGEARPETQAPELRPVVLGVAWERPALKERIKARLQARFDQGMVEEVKRLVSSGISEERISLFGMEYRHISRYIRGAVGFEEMNRALLHDIEQLSKRQMTWFRGMERRGIPIHWVKEANLDLAMAVLKQFEFTFAEFDGYIIKGI